MSYTMMQVMRMMLMRSCGFGLLMAGGLGGCAASRPGGPMVNEQGARSANTLQHYRRAAGDPDWLVRAGEFHGHLGPWLVVGALVGQDAVRRLDTPGQWAIEVTCWMPPDKRRTPFSCMLDGLQVSSGATLGKQNIRFDYSAEVLSTGCPVVYVVRIEDDRRPREGLVYRATGRLHDLLRQVKPERLEDGSRDLAREDVARLFEVRAMTEDELTRRG